MNWYKHTEGKMKFKSKFGLRPPSKHTQVCRQASKCNPDCTAGRWGGAGLEGLLKGMIQTLLQSVLTLLIKHRGSSFKHKQSPNFN